VLSRLWRVPFTYEVQDMWPETLQATGMVRSQRVLDAVARYCRWTYDQASGVRVISEGFRKNLIDKGVSPAKVRYIPNWVDVEFYRRVPRDERLTHELGMSGRFNVVYAGTIGPAQGLGVVLDAAAELGDLPEVQFVLAGEGLDQARLAREAKRRRLTNVKFLGRRPNAEMPGLYALSDALFVHLNDDPLFRITVPHKTLTYLASGRPLLAAVEGDVAALVQRAEAGVTCRPSDLRGLAAAVRRLHSMSPQQRERCGERGRRVAVDEFERSKVVAELAELLVGVARGWPRRFPLE
jgi:glycosyltransferase involved in cell wall biosynthesis